MANKNGHGGKRAGAGRPKGSKNKTFKKGRLSIKGGTRKGDTSKARVRIRTTKRA